MKRSYLAAALALTLVLGLGVTARAQDVNGVVVTVPFDFVAGGITFQAGEYRIAPVTPGNVGELAVRSYKNGSAFLLPIVFDSVPGERSSLTFEQVGGTHVLSSITTVGGVFTITTPREIAKLAQNTKDTMPVSGTR